MPSFCYTKTSAYNYCSILTKRLEQRYANHVIQSRDKEQEYQLLKEKNQELEEQLLNAEEAHQEELSMLKSSISTLEDQLTTSVLSSTSSGPSIPAEQRKLESLAIRIETLRDHNRDLESQLEQSKSQNEELEEALATLQKHFEVTVREIDSLEILNNFRKLHFKLK